MYRRNDGSDEVNALQNQFTAYLTTAVRNEKLRYLRKRNRLQQRETTLEESYLLLEQKDYIKKDSVKSIFAFYAVSCLCYCP